MGLDQTSARHPDAPVTDDNWSHARLFATSRHTSCCAEGFTDSGDQSYCDTRFASTGLKMFFKTRL